MLRTSSYTLYVDLPGNEEEMLLVHGYSGAHDKVSRRVASYLRSLEVHRPPKPLYGDWSPEPAVDGEVPAPSQEVLGILRRRGYLTTLTPAEEEDLFARVVEKIHARQSQRGPGYILMPTYDCNLRCSYCFQDHMRTDARFNHLLRVITPQMADRTFLAMLHLESRHGIESRAFHRRITFFGGEPLLAEARPMVEYIVKKALSLGEASFSAVSNGTDLDEYRALLGPKGISEMQITLDGPPREHDKRRIYADGSGSFERIAENISMALDLGVVISVRMNIDRNNVDQLPELADEIVARGWNRHPSFSAYVAPVRAENEKTSVKSTMSNWELEKELARLRAMFDSMAVISHPDEVAKVQAQRIFRGEDFGLYSLKSSFCAAHTSMYIFDAFGDIYACWERTGDPTVRIGRVLEDGDVELNVELTQMWRSRTVASNPVCRKCRYALHCGGGCAVLALAQSGRFFSNFCDGFAARFRANLAEAYQDFVAGIHPDARQHRVCDM